MSSDAGGSKRPQQVTLWSWVGIAAALIVVVSAFDTVAGAGSLQTSEMLRELLSQPPWSMTGLDIVGAREMFRVLAMVSAAGAAAAAILLWQCLRRDRNARIGLSVAALATVAGGIVTGGLSPAVVGAAALMMWLQPARDWFAGRESSARPLFEANPPRQPRQGPPPPPAPGDQRHDGSPPPPDGPEGPLPYAAQGWAPPFPPRPDVPSRRPSALVRACALALVFSAAALMVTVGGAIALAASPDQVMADLREQDPALFEQGFTQDELLVGVYLVLAGFAVWCLAAMALAALALAGQDWARIVLVVSAAGAGMLAAVAAVAQPVMLVVVVAAALTAVQLLRPEVTAWYRRRSARPRP